MNVSVDVKAIQCADVKTCVLLVCSNNSVCNILYREYAILIGQRWEEREAFRREFRRRHSTMALCYPLELNDLPPFASWVANRVQTLRATGEHVHEDVIQYGQPPQRYAISHRQMHAFVMHLRVRSAEGGLVTQDSCVVASFTQQLRWGLRNGQPIERIDDYVGYIEEILELDYRNHCTTILVCDWVRGTQDVRFPNVQRDRYGFAVANFNHMDGRVHTKSFAFPLHCQQVFFSDDPHKRGWKVVCRTDVRARRGHPQINQIIPSMIHVGHDEDFQGLQLEMLDTEPTREVAIEGGIYIPTSSINLSHEEEGQRQ